MDRPLEFLIARVKNRAERHRSLRSAIDWGYRTLSPRTQDAFPKLAVARGGWSLELAEAVFQSEMTFIFQELLDASLIWRVPELDPSRFRMHAVLREFGLELLSHESSSMMRERLLDSLLQKFEIDNPSSLGPKLKGWLDTAEVEIENIRESLAWAWEKWTRRKGSPAIGLLERFLVSARVSA